MRLGVVAFTHRGRVRPTHEDAIVAGSQWYGTSMRQPEASCHLLSDPLVCAVADGMGGHVAGAVASQQAARLLVEAAPALHNETAIAGCLRQVNGELFSQMDESPEMRGMGTTVAGIVATPGEILGFNVGDSRVYREQDGFLRQMTIDDRPAPRSHRLTQALGGAAQHADIEPHVWRDALLDGRRYLICSDGLTDVLDVDAIEACLGSDDVATVERLFERAMAAGGEDNISIILARIESGERESPAL